MNEMSIKDHLLVRGQRIGLALLVMLLAALGTAFPVSAAKSPQLPLDAGTIPQFAQPLPLLSIGGDGTSGIATFGGSDRRRSTSVSSMRRCCRRVRQA